jgi:hypothetical protein
LGEGVASRGRKSESKILRTDAARREFHVDPLHGPSCMARSGLVAAPTRKFTSLGDRWSVEPGARALRNAASVDPSSLLPIVACELLSSAC